MFKRLFIVITFLVFFLSIVSLVIPLVYWIITDKNYLVEVSKVIDKLFNLD